MSDAQTVSALRGAGFSEEEISLHIAPTIQALRGGGFSELEIADHFGIPSVPAFDPAPIAKQFDEALRDINIEEGGVDLTFVQAVEAGFQQSIGGLLGRQKVPDIIVPEEASAADRIVSGLVAVTLDLPVFAVGAGLAAPAGGGLASAATATAGAFALPAALREILMRTYQDGRIQTFEQFWDVLSSTYIEGFKGFTVGAGVGVAGPVAGAGVAAKLGQRAITPLASSTASRAAEIATMVTVGSALEGEIPSANDFIDASVIILTLAGAKKGAKSLRATYKNTGRTPEKVIEDVSSEPTIREDMASKNHSEEPRAYKPEVREATKEEVVTEVDAKSGKDVADVLRGKEAEPVVEPKEPVEPPAEPPAKKSALEQVKENISFKTKKERRTFSETMDSLYADWFKSQHPLNKAVKEMANGSELSIVENAAKLKQLEAGAVSKIGAFLEFGMRDFKNNKVIGKSLKAVLEPVRNEFQSLAAHLVAKRTLEVGTMTTKVINPKPGEAKVITVSRTGVDMDVAARAVIEGRAKFEAVAQDLLTFQRQVLEYLRDAELISKESFDLMTAAGKNYTPLHRVMDEGAGVTSKGAGRKARDPIFRFRGSELEIINPLESIIKNTYTYILVAERNQIGLQFTRQATAAGRTDLARRVKEKQRPVTIKPEEVRRAIKKFDKGKELSEEEASALESFAEDGFTIFRSNGLKAGENQIIVMDKGKKTLWDIDPEVMRVFNDGSPLTNNIVMKVLGAPARLLRAGAVLAPEFAVRNPARDSLTSFIVSDNKLRLFVDFGHGIASVARRDSAFQDWVASGGASSAMVSLDRPYLQKGIGDLMGPQGLGNQLFNAVRNPIEMLRLVAELGEAGTRVGEMKRALKGKKGTKEELLQAALDSREVSLDFAQMGTQARAVNMIVPFFAAQLNGVDKVVRSFKNHPTRTAAKVAATITVPSVLLYLHNREQDWYKKLAPWIKDTTWPIRVNGVTWKIPKPFELGIIFGTGAERIVEHMISQDPKAFDGFGKAAFEAFTPSFIPAAISPAVETFANRKLFFDTPVIPGVLEPLLPEYQFKRYTTEISKALGTLIATFPGMKQSQLASPLVIENFVFGWTGGLGRTVLNAMDFALRKAGALPDPPRPAQDILQQIPAVKGFIVRHPTLGTAPIEEFFKRLEENERFIKTIKFLAKQGDIEAVEREAAIAGQARLIPLRGYADTINQLTAVARGVSNPILGLTPEEQRQIIDQLYLMINATAEVGLEILDEQEKLQ